MRIWIYHICIHDQLQGIGLCNCKGWLGKSIIGRASHHKGQSGNTTPAEADTGNFFFL